jgi:tRNA(fMet)-specific endonuclease VapC
VGRRLILDLNILIAYERGTTDRSALDNDELAVASVSVAEYRVGIELAGTASRAAERARALVAITSAVDVLDYTQATATHRGRLLAPVRRSRAMAACVWCRVIQCSHSRGARGRPANVAAGT